MGVFWVLRFSLNFFNRTFITMRSFCAHLERATMRIWGVIDQTICQSWRQAIMTSQCLLTSHDYDVTMPPDVTVWRHDVTGLWRHMIMTSQAQQCLTSCILRAVFRPNSQKMASHTSCFGQIFCKSDSNPPRGPAARGLFFSKPEGFEDIQRIFFQSIWHILRPQNWMDPTNRTF